MATMPETPMGDTNWGSARHSLGTDATVGTGSGRIDAWSQPPGGHPRAPQTGGGFGGPDGPSTASLLGRNIIGQYVIEARLGEGGMGEVYRADQPEIGRKVAIKVLHPHLFRDPETVERFRIEARAAARLQDPHVVSIFNYGDMGDGTLFLAMEYLEGQTLSAALKQLGKFDSWRAIRVIMQCCSALADAHAAGVVHRDLKPSNIMLVQRGTESDFVKVLDFGVAQLEGSRMTKSGDVFGTPQYMSPEQLRGEAIDGRSDLSSLGVILYELLTGRLPFRSTNMVGYVHLHLNEAPPPFREANPNVSIHPAIEAAVMHALAKAPESRPQSAQAMAAELEGALAGRSPLTNASSQGPMPAAPAPVDAAMVPAPPPARRGAPVGLVVGLAVGALVLGVGGTVGAMMFLAPKEAEAVADAEEDAEHEAEEETAKPPEAPEGVAAPPKEANESGADTGAEPAGDDGANADAAKPTFSRAASANLSPEAKKLLEMSLEDLEKELDKALAGSLTPPSIRKQTRDSYELQKSVTADGEVGDAALKSQLVQIIVAYKAPNMQAKPGDRLSRAELEKTFMTMEMKTPLEEKYRRQTLDTVIKNIEEGDYAEEDREFYIKMSLAAMIRNMAKDPKIIDGEDAK